MANSYTFNSLNFPNISTTFQAITGINNAGTLIGFFGSGQPASTAPSTSFVFTVVAGVGTFTPFSSGSFPQVRLRGINNASVPSAVGTSVSGSGATTGGVTVSPTPGGTVTDAGLSAGGGTNPRLTGINDSGTEVGWYVVSGSGATEIDQAATVSGGALVPITFSLAAGAGTITSSRAYGVDNLGDVVGMAAVSLAGGGSVTEGFFQAAGAGSPTGLYTAATDLAGVTQTQITATNNQGQIAGDYVDAGGRTHGFVKDLITGLFTSIDAPASTGAIATHVLSINDQGDVVGYYDVPTVVGGVATVVANSFLETLNPSATGQLQAVANPTAGSTIAVVLGSRGAAAGGATVVTMLDPGFGHVTLIGNVAGDTYNVFGASDTVVADAGSAANTINDATGGAALIFLGNGANTVTSGLASTIVASGGADSIIANGSIVFAAQRTSGNDTVLASPTLMGVATTANTIVGGAGYTAVDGIASVGGTLFFGGSGLNYFAGTGLNGMDTTGGAATVVGTSGTNYFTEAAGGGVLFGGSGPNYLTGNSIAQSTTPGNIPGTTIVANEGRSTITAYSGAVFLGGTADQVVLSELGASVGNLSLVGNLSSGNNVFVLSSQTGASELVDLGAGRDSVFLGNGGKAQIVAGTGADSFVIGSNVVSGSDTIYGFKPGADRVLLQNYNAASVSSAISRQQAGPGGSAVVTLNGVKIEFFGIGQIGANSFGST